jgi:serine/threonine protein kinase
VRQGDEVAGRLDRTVALKILSPIADGERFRRESQAIAALAHENVMRVYDYGEDEAGPLMAVEWLPGGCDRCDRRRRFFRSLPLGWCFST